VRPACHGGSVLAPDPCGDDRTAGLVSLADAVDRFPRIGELVPRGEWAYAALPLRAGLASTASLALYGWGRGVIRAMGVAWARAQAFTDAQKDKVRVVARLAADALGRAQMLEAECAARERTERLQRTMTALVASASLAEVTAAVFQHGLPFGASAARLALVGQQQPGLLMTLNEVGFPESVGAGGEALPVSAPSPSREAAATSATIYLPTPEDLDPRPCSMLWISSWAAGRTYCPRPSPSPLSTPPIEHSGIASPDIRPCCCATPTGPSPCSTRRGGRY
jgi:hypothetical protein